MKMKMKINSFRIAYIVCIVLFSIFFTISIGISTYFVYYHWYLKKYSLQDDFNTHKKQQFIEHINERN